MVLLVLGYALVHTIIKPGRLHETSCVRRVLSTYSAVEISLLRLLMLSGSILSVLKVVIYSFPNTA